ncbi:unnamed protein product [Rotaria magnacalcarata]|uniref:Uncharacterized protein n=1 Tax=Rotaria magnacalcarata TaxID=392030 RepID=A0A816WRX9_9BILA|nr:unnamed protein product [Rotaria magnacalcarata]
MIVDYSIFPSPQISESIVEPYNAMLVVQHHSDLTAPGRTILPPDPVGYFRKYARKSPYLAGKHGKSLEHGSSIPVKNTVGLFRRIPAKFRSFRAGIDRKSSENFPTGILLPQSQRNITGTGRFQGELFDLGDILTCFDNEEALFDI